MMIPPEENGSFLPAGADAHRALLTTGKVNFDLEFTSGTVEVLERAFDCLRPVFRTRGGSDAHFTVLAKNFDALPGYMSAQATQAFALRRSSARPFNLDLMTGVDDAGCSVGVDHAGRTAYHADPAGRTLTFFVSGGSHFHLIETLRYTALAAEQVLGSVCLHASSAALHNGAAVLVLGNKGHGKTTTLLTLIERHGLGYFSGDKVLLDRHDGKVRLRAWPDYPHIAIGTLRMFPRLAAACSVDFEEQGEPLPDARKALIEPPIFRAALRRSGAVATDRCGLLLFPDVRRDDVSLTKIETVDNRIAVLQAAVEDARIFVPGQWHRLIETPAQLEHPPRSSC